MFNLKYVLMTGRQVIQRNHKSTPTLCGDHAYVSKVVQTRDSNTSFKDKK